MLYPTREMITPQVTAEGNSISIKTNVIDSVDAWKVRYHLYEADGVTPVMGKPANTTGKFYGLDNGKHYIVRTTATARSAKTQKDRMIESGDVEVEIAYDSFTAEEVKQLAGIILGQFKIPDATPDSFSVSDKLDQSINTVVTTNAITVSGINVEVDASTTLGTIVKNGTNT